MQHSSSAFSASFESESASPAKSPLAEMYFSPALVLAALPFLVVATPFEDSLRGGISIPIAKRSGLRNADGVVGVAKLRVGVQHTVALVSFFFVSIHDLFDDETLCRKIQRGFEAFENNTGAAHPYASQLKRSTKRGNGDPLTDDNAELWFGSITVGTPAKTYTGKSSLRTKVAKINHVTCSGLRHG